MKKKYMPLKIVTTLSAALAILAVCARALYGRWLIQEAQRAASDPIIFQQNQQSAIGIIGGADGPTAVFVTSTFGPQVSFWILTGVLVALAAAGTAALLILRRRDRRGNA